MTSAWNSVLNYLIGCQYESAISEALEQWDAGNSTAFQACQCDIFLSDADNVHCLLNCYDLIRKGAVSVSFSCPYVQSSANLPLLDFKWKPQGHNSNSPVSEVLHMSLHSFLDITGTNLPTFSKLHTSIILWGLLWTDYWEIADYRIIETLQIWSWFAVVFTVRQQLLLMCHGDSSGTQRTGNVRRWKPLSENWWRESRPRRLSACCSEL
jgi:hypothetical protein